MEINEYQELAMRTLSKDLKGKDMLINGVMGLCGESGEVIDLVKKYLSNGIEVDKEDLLLEIGDVCWYIAELATYLNVPMEEIFKKNIEKLQKRYPEGYKKVDILKK